jgi:hypothetical protein
MSNEKLFQPGLSVCSAYWIARYKTRPQIKIDEENHRISSALFKPDVSLHVKLNKLIHRWYIQKFELYDELFYFLTKCGISEFEDFFVFVFLHSSQHYPNIKSQFYISPRFFMKRSLITQYVRSFGEDLFSRHSHQLFYSSLQQIILFCHKHSIDINQFFDRYCLTFEIFGKVFVNKLSAVLCLSMFTFDNIDKIPHDIKYELETKFSKKFNEMYDLSIGIINRRFKSLQNFKRLVNQGIKNRGNSNE